MDGSLWHPRFEERPSRGVDFIASSPTGLLITFAVMGLTQIAIGGLLVALAVLGADFHVPGAFMID